MERTIKITRRIKNQDSFYDHFGIIDGNLKTTRYRKVLQETYEWDYYPIINFTRKHLEYLLISTQELNEEADEKRMIKEYYIKRCLLILEKINTCDVNKEEEWEELFTILKRYLREW